ncbi:hypothetical protein NQT62_04630 [Limnobacter humi]|uniref:Uncharacterized protein n=1 Tax=Limnobacter humi TaxID=1778671 RepID=A0ABT1WDY1_9BURK|nr:hypothetical protein [Limnobacter humi]MCQ8895728.1 hypothetical protein [Limnobacter humi]
MPSLDGCIIEQCNAVWDEEFLSGVKNRNNCSGFVKAVAKRLGIPLPDTATADGIAAAVESNWTKVESGAEAARLAYAGQFVLAVLKAKDHQPKRSNGHVAIVVYGDLYRHRYPKVWGGSIGAAQSRGDKSVGEVWNNVDRDQVGYFAYGLNVCKR